MYSNKLSEQIRPAISDQPRPRTLKGVAAALLFLLVVGFVVVGAVSTLYERLLPPVERVETYSRDLDYQIEREFPMPEPLRAPEVPKHVAAETGLCTPGPSGLACVEAAIARAERENAEAGRKYDEEVAAYNQRSDEIEAVRVKRNQETQRRTAAGASVESFAKRVAERWQFWASAGLLLVAAAIMASRREPELPDHRDPAGAAAAAVRAESDPAPLAAVTAAAGATLLASLHSFGAFAIVGGIAVLAVWAAIAVAKSKALAAVGYRVADQRWQEAAAAAERAGLAPPPEPRIGEEEAQRLGATGGFTAPEGSAMAVMLDGAGRPDPAAVAWLKVAQALGLGGVDEHGRFIPWAVIENAWTWAETGDVQLDFRLEDVTKTAVDMTRAAGPLLRELRVRSLVGGAFTTRHEDGRVVGVFTNNAEASAAAPAAAAVDDDWDF